MKILTKQILFYNILRNIVGHLVYLYEELAAHLKHVRNERLKLYLVCPQEQHPLCCKDTLCSDSLYRVGQHRQAVSDLLNS